jgi:small subunit ribosomal protein S9
MESRNEEEARPLEETPETTSEGQTQPEAPPETSAEATPPESVDAPVTAGETAEEAASEQPAQPEAEGERPAAEQPAAEQPEEEESPEEAPAEEAPRRLTELAADARYFATGKRKSSVARVIIRPGKGSFDLNGRDLQTYFPRRKHQAVVREPLEVAGFLERVDVRARIHGGGVGGQADAVKHGIAKALIEADPALRVELKRRQLLTRDPRVKERRKAGLKKARKRPQFSKR